MNEFTQRIVSHRGNINGIDKKNENRPEKILEAANKYKVEVDVWCVDNKYFLGHNKPQYEIDKLFLFSEKILSHCKNLEAFNNLKKHHMVEAFFQDSDQVALTTKRNLVYHSSVNPSDVINNSYVVNLDKSLKYNTNDNLSIITDFPEFISSQIKSTVLNIPFDLLIIDIDGVMTNGQKIYNLDGTVQAKSFCDKDFTAIKRFKNIGVNVCFLSGDKSNEKMAVSRNTDFYYARLPNGNIDKSVFLDDLINKYNSKKVAYVGDDYYDISLLESVDISIAPNDALYDVKNIVDLVTDTKGGEGVIAEIFHLYKKYFFESFAFDDYKS